MPMPHKARQFHHIMEMVDGLDAKFLRGKVRHLPLFIAAKNFDRERLNQSTASKGDGENKSETYELVGAYKGSNNLNKFDHNETAVAVSNTSRSKLKQNKRTPKVVQPPGDRSISTYEYLSTNKVTDPVYTSRLGTSSTDVISPYNGPSKADTNLGNPNYLLLHSTPYLVEDFGNGDDFNTFPNHNSTSSGTCPAKRRWSVTRKSPTSRVTHNMNEKNRRADLRESLDKLKRALPQFKNKSCKSTTSDILLYGYRFVTEALSRHKRLLEHRCALFEASKNFKLQICQLILENNVLVSASNKPMDDSTKLIFHKFIEMHSLLDASCLLNGDFLQVLIPSLDYKALETVRKKYLQSVSISASPSALKNNFCLLTKTISMPSNLCTLMPSSSRHDTTSSNTLNNSGDSNNLSILSPGIFNSPYKVPKDTTTYNMEDRFPASSIYTHPKSPLGTFSMVKMPNAYTLKYSLEEIPHMDPNKVSTATVSFNSSSTNSVSISNTTTTPLTTSANPITINTNEFSNATNSSYSSNQQIMPLSANVSANISDEDEDSTNVNTSFFVGSLISDRTFDSKSETTNKSTDTLSISGLINSNSKSSG